MRLLRLDIAQAAGNHNRLVVAAHLAVKLLLEGAEIAQQIRAAEFVVKRRAADGAVDHNIQRRSQMAGLAVGLLPRLGETGNIEIGHGKAGQTRFRPRAATGCALVADFAARAGGRARKRRDGGGVVVGFHFHQNVRVFLGETVALIFRRMRIKTPDFRAFDNRRIVFIGHHRALGVRLVGVADHAEQGFLLRLPV